MAATSTEGNRSEIAASADMTVSVSEHRAVVVASERMRRMYAALTQTSEAVMRCSSPMELFQKVCDSAVDGTHFLGAGVVLPDGETALRYVVASGLKGIPAIETLPSFEIATQRTMIVEAYCTGKPVISADYCADGRISGIWKEFGRIYNVNSSAAVPILRGGKVEGVISFYLEARGAVDEEMIGLMTRMAENIAFALDNFERAEARRKADARIKYLASHDELTGLPNRRHFSYLLDDAIEAAKRDAGRFALLFIDLDRFKIINDTLGHDAGDRLLCIMGERITNCLRSDDVVARLGGDEFVVVLRETRSPESVAQAAKNLLAAICQPMELSGQECRVSASIGIALYPDHGDDAATLTKRADLAMYDAKDEGKDGFRFYSDALKSQSIERLRLESDLRGALERREFEIHYQPKVDLVSDQVSGVEALVRWRHPELGMVSPGQFVPLAEETGLIVPIGRWVLREACRQNMEWQAMGLPPVTMAVNLSPRQFSHERLLADIDEALADSAMPPEMLQIEVTESMMMRRVESGIELLGKMKARGIRIAIDDFGTGYSSLSYLQRFPVDTLKIDRSFVSKLDGSKSSGAISLLVISMGKALGLTVVAEGVENEAQKKFLAENGCDEMQGFLFSKPLASRDLVALLRSQPDPAPLQPVAEERRVGPRDRRGRKGVQAAQKLAVLH